MKFELTWLNGFLLILPLVGWNLVLGPHLADPRVTSDAHSPKWLLWAEATARAVVFALPILLPIGANGARSRSGAEAYALGTMVYFGSWLPLLLASGSSRSKSPAGLLAPRLTPFLPFLGIFLLCNSWLYALPSAVFVALHTMHGVQNLTSPRTPG